MCGSLMTSRLIGEFLRGPTCPIRLDMVQALTSNPCEKGFETDNTIGTELAEELANNWLAEQLLPGLD